MLSYTYDIKLLNAKIYFLAERIRRSLPPPPHAKNVVNEFQTQYFMFKDKF
jgi:hypothetical protein